MDNISNYFNIAPSINEANEEQKEHIASIKEEALAKIKSYTDPIGEGFLIESAKNTLVGNISQSYNLIDENDYFLNELLEPLCKIYLETSPLKIFQPTCITVEDQIGSLTIVPRFQLSGTVRR